MRNLIALGASLLIVFAAAGVGSYFTATTVKDWYPTLVLPSWRPPSWLFGPVWTALYISMALAAWLVWKEGWGRPEVRVATWLFAAQLALNAMWSVLFFGLRMPGLAFFEIVLLDLLVLSTIVAYFPISKLAGWLMVPYLLWLSFASVLNFRIAADNGGFG